MAKQPERPEFIWIFDLNRRVYGRDKSVPIWREHWSKRKVTGETSRSWIVDEGWGERKIAKNEKLRGWGIAFSEAELDVLEWIEHAKPEIHRRTTFSRLTRAQVVALADAFGVSVPDFVRAWEG